MNTTYLHEIPAIREGLEHLLSHDPIFKSMGIQATDIKRGADGYDYDTLVRIVIGQQVSTSAAKSMWEKLSNALPSITPATILAQNDDDLRSMGLSRQKVTYVKEMATHFENGTINIEKLAAANDEDVAKSITSVKGFGPWSAEIYLMFGLGRPDIWPAKDLGIQDGLKRYHKMDSRPDETQTKKMGEDFRPYRTSAALLLWHLKAMP